MRWVPAALVWVETLAATDSALIPDVASRRVGEPAPWRTKRVQQDRALGVSCSPRGRGLRAPNSDSLSGLLQIYSVFGFALFIIDAILSVCCAWGPVLWRCVSSKKSLQ